MDFDKPRVEKENLAAILSPYNLGTIKSIESLGGIPNTTFKVVTDKQVVAVRIYSIGQSSLRHIELEIEILIQLASKGFISPRPVAGTDGNYLQYWGKYPILVTEYIEGKMADELPLTPRLGYQIGTLLTTFSRAMESLDLPDIPAEEYLISKGNDVLATINKDLERRGWEMDISRVPKQWQRSTQKILNNFDSLNPTVIHSDFWPPNLKCKGEEIVGLMDFDDWTYGPAIFDLVVAFQECSMFGSAEVDEDIAINILKGYFENGGKMTGLERSVFPDAIELFCSLFLAYNIVQADTFDEAYVYLKRLHIMAEGESRANFRAQIDRLIGEARKSGS